MKGRLIVFEGLDSAGKKTQALALLKRLRALGGKAEVASFPTYEKTVFGKLVGNYLRGEMRLTPYEAALAYALDRAQFREALLEKLRAGKTIVVDRYVYSNFYQAARIKPEQRKWFVAWLECLEAPMPKADAVVFLDVPPEVSERLLEARGAKIKRFRGRDILEKSLEYQREVRKVYLSEAKKRKWIVVDCWKKIGGDLVMRPRQEIHESVWHALKKKRIA